VGERVTQLVHRVVPPLGERLLGRERVHLQLPGGVARPDTVGVQPLARLDAPKV